MRLKTFLLYTIQILRKEIRQLLEFHTLSDHRTSLNRFVREILLTVCYSLKICIFALHVLLGPREASSILFLCLPCIISKQGTIVRVQY